jgi:hypothetical protein
VDGVAHCALDNHHFGGERAGKRYCRLFCRCQHGKERPDLEHQYWWRGLQHFSTGPRVFLCVLHQPHQ